MRGVKALGERVVWWSCRTVELQQPKAPSSPLSVPICRATDTAIDMASRKAVPPDVVGV